MRWLLALSTSLCILCAPETLCAADTTRAPSLNRPVQIDRVAVRWHAPATGGVEKPQFISARLLAFLARLEALVSVTPIATPYESKHVRLALQRHITETILASLPVSPEPTPKEMGDYAEDARLVLEQQITVRLAKGASLHSNNTTKSPGRRLIARAAVAEGIDANDLDAILMRRARASWYLDKMVAPMLQPSTSDLIAAQRSGQTPYTKQSFQLAKKQLRDWFLATRLAEALDRYYRNVRSTVRVKLIMPTSH